MARQVSLMRRHDLEVCRYLELCQAQADAHRRHHLENVLNPTTARELLLC